MQNSDKRRYKRLDSVINGSFCSREDNISGEMIMTDSSRSGLRVALNQPVLPGRILQVELMSREKNMPLFATGKVVWLRERKKDSMYNFDAGIQLLEEGSLNRQQPSEYDFGNWHIKQIAAYARHRGYLAKSFPENSYGISCFIPSIFLLYIVFGAVFCFVYPGAAWTYAASLITYLGAILFLSLFDLMQEKSGKLISEKLKLILPVTASRISTHLTYGLCFLLGLLEKGS